MYPSAFRERALMLSKEVLSKNPPSMTGYFDSPAKSTEELLKSAPDVSMNGQRASFRLGANTGVVFRTKDPNGSKEAVGFTTYRVNGLLTPGNTGKLVSMNFNPGEVLLADAIFQGSRFQSPTIVSMMSTARPPDSTIMGAREQESAVGPINPNAPVDPMSPNMTRTPDGSSPSSNNSNNGPFGTSGPSINFDDLNHGTGEEFLVPEPKDSGTPWGTNARTGTTHISEQEFLKPTLPSYTSSGWSFSGLPTFRQDLGQLFKR